MSLHDKNLPKNPGEQFKDIEGKINTSGSDLANVIAKYREEMIDVLKNNEAEGTDDENTLNGLITELKNKKLNLKTDLGKTPPSKIDLSDNTDISNFRESIVDNSNPMILGKPGDGGGAPTNAEKKNTNAKIIEALKKIQFVHDDGTGTVEKTFKLFKGASTDMTDIIKTSSDPLIKQLLNETDPTKVSNLVDNFVNSVISSKGKTGGGNPFFISTTKLDEKGKDEERKVAIRIALYLYCIYKVINPNIAKGEINKFSKALYTDINEKLDQIIDKEIPKIKGLHNTKVELGYLEPEYATLKDLNVNAGDKDLGSKDLTAGGAGLSEERDLKADFENGIATGLERYEVDTSNIKIKDGDGNPIVASLNDGTRDITSLFADIGNTKDADLSLEIGGKKLKIGKIVIDNLIGAPKFSIKFDDEATIKAEATAKLIAIPKFPLDFSINLKGIKDVKNGLKGCKASLTKKYKAILAVGGGPIILNAQRERETTISNVDQVNRAIAEREADEELRERYRNSGRNVFDKANLFLRRKFIKDRIVDKKMGGKSKIDWSESGQSAAHRHQIEKQENLADNLNALVDIDKNNYPQTRAMLDKLIDDVTGKSSVPPWTAGISDSSFQTQFEYILNKSGKDFDQTKPGTATIVDWKPVSEIIKSNNIKSLSTNILMQAKQFQAHQHMVYTIQDHIATNPTEGDDVFNVWCRGEIENYINTYDDIPDFLQQMGLSIDNVDHIKTLKSHTASLAAIQAQALKYRVQILDGGSEAYNVKKRGGLLTKVGRFLDDPTENSKFFNKHKNLKEAAGWIRGGAKIGAMIAPGRLLAPAGPLAIAAGVGGMSAMTTLLKKKTHYEKENRSYQRMQATNLTDYRNKRTNLANEVAGMKWYEGRFWGKKKRTRDQYNDYVLTSQDQLSQTNTLLTNIKTYLKKGTVLTGVETDELGKLLADGLARLDYHKKTGQNFLGSDDPTIAEKEYRQLQNAIIGGTLRLKIDVNDLRSAVPYVVYYDTTKNTIENGTGNEYNTQGYLKAKKRFEKRSNIKAGVGALKAGAVSFGLSYLASSLASNNSSRTIDTYTEKHHGPIGGEYNLGDAQEHLFVSGDVNPAMNSVITPDTQNITGATIYSSVDSVPCSITKGASELASANSDLSATFSSSPFSGNTAWIDAKTNFINEARTSIWSTPGVSEGNRQLALARAIEGRNEGILKPAIAAQAGKPASAALIGIDPSAIHWVDGGMQGTSTGVMGQSFRNMGLVGIDYVQHGTKSVTDHVTRAITIPVGLNTFGAPKSDPK